MTTDNGREELARRLYRVFLAEVGKEEQVIPYDHVLRFADDILAADYTDPKYGPRLGDGGPAARFVLVERHD